MGITASGLRALNGWISDAAKGGPSKQKLNGAVKLTEAQRLCLEEALRKYWGRTDYACPDILGIKPLHGYESRVDKDGFSPWQLEKWWIRGCDDTAAVCCDILGRPRLVVTDMQDFPPHVYDIVVPIRSDSNGSVYIDDVIPDGLPGQK